MHDWKPSSGTRTFESSSRQTIGFSGSGSYATHGYWASGESSTGGGEWWMSGTQRYAFGETQSGSVSDQWSSKDGSWSPTRFSATSHASSYVDYSYSGSGSYDLVTGGRKGDRLPPFSVAATFLTFFTQQGTTGAVLGCPETTFSLPR